MLIMHNLRHSYYQKFLLYRSEPLCSASIWNVDMYIYEENVWVVIDSFGCKCRSVCCDLFIL